MILDIRTHKMILMIVGGTFLLIISTLLLFKFVLIDNKTEISDLDDSPSFGEYLSWEKVNKIFPKYAYATVVDLDTGLKFQVQRRGGSSHVDAQPLTAADSATMKTIYQGQWSWKRKAVLVQLYSGRMIAASMNGMPHGRGAIEQNDFDGHFCIHFRDCKTHGSKKTDLAHQMMIWKAANVFEQQLQSKNREDIIAIFFTAINEHELNMAGKLIGNDIDVKPLLLELAAIADIKADEIRHIEGNKYSVEVRVVYKDSKRELRKNLIIFTANQEPYWRIEADSIIPLLDKNTGVVSRSSMDSHVDEEDLIINHLI